MTEIFTNQKNITTNICYLFTNGSKRIKKINRFFIQSFKIKT